MTTAEAFFFFRRSFDDDGVSRNRNSLAPPQHNKHNTTTKTNKNSILSHEPQKGRENTDTQSDISTNLEFFVLMGCVSQSVSQSTVLSILYPG